MIGNPKSSGLSKTMVTPKVAASSKSVTSPAPKKSTSNISDVSASFGKVVAKDNELSIDLTTEPAHFGISAQSMMRRETHQPHHGMDQIEEGGDDENEQSQKQLDKVDENDDEDAEGNN